MEFNFKNQLNYFFVLFLFLHMSFSYAANEVVNLKKCTSPTNSISGKSLSIPDVNQNFTIYLSRDESDPYPVGETIATSKLVTINCDYYPGKIMALSLASGGGGLYDATSTEGYYINTSPTPSYATSVGVAFALRSSTGIDKYARDVAAGDVLSTSDGTNSVSFQLVVSPGSSVVFGKAGSFTFSSGAGGATMATGISDAGNPDYLNETTTYVKYTINVNVILTSCSITSSKLVTVNWPALSPNEISSGEAEIKNTPISIHCGEINTPVTMRVTSSNGSEDDVNGIIKTTLPNLGLKLTWSKDGTPVPLNKDIKSTLLGDYTYDISAQPVKIGPDSEKISAGDFATTVTVSYEYR